MTLSVVVATAPDNAIGKYNALLWRMPADLKHFKDITSGHAVIMGRKTFDSIGKPLPNRRNIIITRQAMQIPGCEVTHNIDEAIDLCRNEAEVFVIGGAEIYRQSLPMVSRVYLTLVHHSFDADTFFPELDKNDWKEISRVDHPSDEKNPYPYSFITLERA
ncbi:dihydrofolate reductase [Mucilaginibacter ginkgonis]|uniref:Dihydrofolate reductase n=1 Tax=Mucilaginibacter ginkgonis TaxID=2682091 RepID=A0A6I4I2P9_9SPHI|nr:dihydrofolate reductase [Mucilaginibacter ginkgonis]QQL50697.1 dihydrofolate reductase [Mucilaginibacter ginkgonis]